MPRRYFPMDTMRFSRHEPWPIAPRRGPIGMGSLHPNAMGQEPPPPPVTPRQRYPASTTGVLVGAALGIGATLLVMSGLKKSKRR